MNFEIGQYYLTKPHNWIVKILAVCSNAEARCDVLVIANANRCTRGTILYFMPGKKLLNFRLFPGSWELFDYYTCHKDHKDHKVLNIINPIHDNFDAFAPDVIERAWDAIKKLV